jgi:hypothetical protein
MVETRETTPKMRRPEPPSGDKVYVIRRVAFMYTDEYYTPVHQAGIECVHTSEATAMSALMACEANRLREVDLGQVAETCGFTDKASAERDRLHDYLMANFGESCFTGPKGDRRADDGRRFPARATDEQMREIGDIIGVRFYELVVFEREPVFFRIWEPEAGIHHGDPDTDFIEFFNSFDEATAVAADRWLWRLAAAETTLESKSDQPGLVRTLLESRTTKEWTREDAIAVNALLRVPLWDVQPMSLEEAEAIDDSGCDVPPSAA